MKVLVVFSYVSKNFKCISNLVWAKIDVPKGYPIFICSFYRPPNNLLQPLIQLQESLNELLNSVVSLPYIILAGEFNLPSIYWSEGSGQLQPNPIYGHKINSLFLDIINDCSLEQFVMPPTRGNNILDLTFSSQPIISDTSIVPGMSDHEAVLFTIHPKAKIPYTKLDYRIFLYHKGNINGVKADMVKLIGVFMSGNPLLRTVEENWNLFKSALLNSVSEHIPQKSIKSCRDLPWLNHEIKNSMLRRRQLYNITTQSGNSEDRAVYRLARNLVNTQLERAHNVYYSQLFDDSFVGNCRQFWKYIQARRKEPSGISTLLIDNPFVSDAKGKVFTREDLLNVPTLEANTSTQAVPSISFNVSGIENLLSNVDPNKAYGPDGISLYILKSCSTEIAPILEIIFKQSLNTGKLPSDWLTANICPVFKRGNRSTSSNYRPISLTASCCKVMEHMIFHSIMDHIKTNNILISNQNGFRPGFSCQTQLISLIDEISCTMDNHCQTDLILLDFSKAFDTVPHKRLLAKLQYYKINFVWKWVQSWLTQRTRSVVVDGASSKPTSVLSGVPQGTVLGPLMFLLYINDITDEVSSTLRLFADDCMLY